MGRHWMPDPDLKTTCISGLIKKLNAADSFLVKLRRMKESGNAVDSYIAQAEDDRAEIGEELERRFKRKRRT